jgi:hypothetical protein
MKLQRRFAIRSIAGLVLLTLGMASLGQENPALAAADATWDALLARHVKWLPDNRQSRLNYRGLKADRAELGKVLAAWSAVPRATFNGWTREQQMAFLINAYNGFTVELILSKYPDLASIKDLGSFLQSPWKKSFFTLLGETRTLDWIEHEQLRPNYADPRIHTAIVCASIGCPALRSEAFTAAKLDAQLEDGLRRFLGDRTRNRYADGKLQVSLIFKWFKDDFEHGHKGFRQVADVFARHADLLADAPADRQKIREKNAAITYLDYDWSLNDLGR